LARRTQVVAVVLDAEGYPHITFRGNSQDVGDAVAIYMQNISNPLGGLDISLPQPVDFIEGREPQEE
jgi:hypothetical protein